MRTELSTDQRRGWALVLLLSTQLMVILDGTIVNVALPTIRDDLGFSQAGLAWVVNGFFVAFALLLLPAGRLGDLVGSRRVFVAGLAVFTLATVAAGLATGPGMLVVARVSQGVGGALTSAVVLGMIAGLYTDDAARARAFALVAFVGSAGASIGVVSGGLLTDFASWRWVFWVNVPIGLAVLLAAPAVLDETPDVPGLRRGLARSQALVPRVLRNNPAFLLPNLVLFTMTVAGFSFQFLTALYLQDSLGLDALHTGLAYLPVTLAIAVTSLGVSGRLAARLGPERVLLAGLLLFVAGMLADGRPARPRHLRRARGARVRRHGGRLRPGDAPGHGAGHGGGTAAGRRGCLRVRQHHPAGGRRRRPHGGGHRGRGPGPSRRVPGGGRGPRGRRARGRPPQRRRRPPSAGSGRRALPAHPRAHPYAGTVLRLDRATYDGIVAHAKRDHPDEACGVVVGPAESDRAERLVEMVNAAGSPTFYEFDSTDLFQLYKEMDANDEEPVVVYHSHTATEAYPSRTDIGLAMEPNAHYVLVSTREHGNNDGPVEFRSYRIIGGEVTEEEVEVVAQLPARSNT